MTHNAADGAIFASDRRRRSANAAASTVAVNSGGTSGVIKDAGAGRGGIVWIVDIGKSIVRVVNVILKGVVAATNVWIGTVDVVVIVAVGTGGEKRSSGRRGRRRRGSVGDGESQA